MKSIRRSLILYFLVLLAGALGAVSVLAYHTAQQTLQAKEEIRQKLLAVGIEPGISKSPEEFGAFIKSQAETREKVIKAVGMKLD